MEPAARTGPAATPSPRPGHHSSRRRARGGRRPRHGLGAAAHPCHAAAHRGRAGLSTSAIAALVDPCLVDVVSTLGYQDAISEGTGLALTLSGEVLTNNHVIEGATSIKITDVGNGRSYPATVAGYDPGGDIAVLQLSGASGLKTVTVSSSSKAAIGEKVIALGNAGGKGGTPAVAAGTVTGLNETITATDEATGTAEQLTRLIRTNAALQAGDSGGPLVSTTGTVIGLDTAASSGYQFQSGTTRASRYRSPGPSPSPGRSRRALPPPPSISVPPASWACKSRCMACRAAHPARRPQSSASWRGCPPPGQASPPAT